MRRYVVALLVIWVLPGAMAAAQAPVASAPSRPEILQIDGSKNPELIPQWSVWGYVFRVFAGGPRQLPTSVLRLVSKAEESLVMKEADAVQKIDADCQSRLTKVVALLGVESIDAVDARVREITVACRRETLHARDRILASLSPEAAAALMAFDESTKAGTSTSLPRKDLARFLEPE
jgi:hypothetical protein